MPITLQQIRDELLPGLREVATITLSGYDMYGNPAMETFTISRGLAAPHVWIPRPHLDIPETLALGAAAAIIKNPEVTRRFWRGWIDID